jgi:hypothetical protein
MGCTLRAMSNVLWIGRAIAYGLAAGAMVLVLGGLQNGLLWNHVLPVAWNDWGVIALAVVAFVVVAWKSLDDLPGADSVW